MRRVQNRLLPLLALGLSTVEPALAQSGGGGRAEGCITVAMPCLFGAQSDPSCAARARRQRRQPGPTADCQLAALTAPGLSREAQAWLDERLRREILPAVCSCYSEGLGIDPRLRGRVGVAVQMTEGCASVDAGGRATLPDRYVVACIRDRFIGFASAPPSREFPPVRSPYAAELQSGRFVVQIDLRPGPIADPPPAAKSAAAAAQVPRR